MNLTTLTCTGDRPAAFALCEKYLARQTLPPSQMLVLDDGEVPVKCTLGQQYHYCPELRGHGSMANKVKLALEKNLITGDGLVFVEDDDIYSPDYLAIVSGWLARYDLVGEGRAIYYNPTYRWWTEHDNMTHASLCMTSVARAGFKVLLAECQNNSDPFIDSRLWKNADIAKAIFAPPKKGVRRTVIGMKSMPGRPGYGGGHSIMPVGSVPDPTLAKLRELVGEDAEAYAKFHQPGAPVQVQENPPKPVRVFNLQEYVANWQDFSRVYEGRERKAADPLNAKVQAEFVRFREQSTMRMVVAPDLPMTPPLPTVEVHLICFNEQDILPYSLRHYKTFARRIVLHDAHSTDRSREIAKSFGAEVRDWNCSAKIDDFELTKIKNEGWLGSSAEWVIMADADELQYFPKGTAASLAAYHAKGMAVVRSRGYELVSEVFPTGDGQIYDEVKEGGEDSHWYGKTILFSPKLLKSYEFGIGAHCSEAVTKDGRKLDINREWPLADPPAYLLHCHHLGPLERVAAAYDRKRANMSESNIKHNFGNHAPGIVHAKEKRDGIRSRLERIFP